MTKRKFERLPIAITLGLFVGLLQVGVLSCVGLSAVSYFYSPAVRSPMEPVVVYAQVFRGQLVYPQFDAPTETVMNLRFVDLNTGKTRDSEILQIMPDRGLVTDGKTLWAIGGDNQIYETNGSDSVTYRTKRKLTGQPSVWNRAFLYEGSPAIIDDDAANVAHLVVLANRDWEDRGQIALPPLDRVWTVDEPTGRTVMVPLVPMNASANPTGWRNIQVIPAEGKYHLFRVESVPGDDANPPTIRLSHRLGFEFVIPPGEGEPVSALAPSNVPAESTDWELLPLRIGRWIGIAAFFDNELLLACSNQFHEGPTQTHIWKQVAATGTAATAGFESVMERNFPGGELSLASSSDSNEVYAISQPRLSELEVYRWNDNRFTKLPFEIDGVVTPIIRKARLFVLQVLAVLWTGTLLLILGTAWLTHRTGPASFAFGQEGVLLAPLIRRSVARMIDLALILSPVVIHVVLRISHTDSETLFRGLIGDRVDPAVIDLPLIVLFVVWAAVAWIAIVISTARWGVSPGKWLCGIRVIRATLRPCGFTRSLLRELLLWIDAPLFLTGMPAVFSWLATDYRQRIGDLAADTIVVCRN